MATQGSKEKWLLKTGGRSVEVAVKAGLTVIGENCWKLWFPMASWDCLLKISSEFVPRGVAFTCFGQTA